MPQPLPDLLPSKRLHLHCKESPSCKGSSEVSYGVCILLSPPPVIVSLIRAHLVWVLAVQGVRAEPEPLAACWWLLCPLVGRTSCH